MPNSQEMVRSKLVHVFEHHVSIELSDGCVVQVPRGAVQCTEPGGQNLVVAADAEIEYIIEPRLSRIAVPTVFLPQEFMQRVAEKRAGA